MYYKIRCITLSCKIVLWLKKLRDIKLVYCIEECCFAVIVKNKLNFIGELLQNGVRFVIREFEQKIDDSNKSLSLLI